MDNEAVEKYHEKANLKQMIQQQREDTNSFRSQILSQDQWKEEVMNSLLQIRRTTRPMEDEETGEIYLQDFIKLEDGSGKWRKPENLDDNQLENLKKGGIVNEEGAEFVLGHLESLTNNNIALSNLTGDEINEICREAELSLRNALINNREKFGISSTDEVREIVASIVRPNMKANFSKAKNGSFISEILREIRMVGSMDDEEDEDEGLMARLG